MISDDFLAGVYAVISFILSIYYADIKISRMRLIMILSRMKLMIMILSRIMMMIVSRLKIMMMILSRMRMISSHLGLKMT